MEPRTVQETSLTASYAIMPSDANPIGNVHGGVIMKHIDNTGGMVAARHARHFCVTASVDHLDFHNPAYIGELLIMKASINLVGRSSMEVGVRVEAENMMSGEVRHIASAYLTYVCIGKDRKPLPVPTLILETDEERRRNCDAQQRRQIRMKDRERKMACGR